jgi:hypothetical protein
MPLGGFMHERYNKKKDDFCFVFYSTVPLLLIYFKQIKSHKPGHLAFIYSDVTWDVLLGLCRLELFPITTEGGQRK